MEKHYTLLKAADLLGVTTQTLRNWDNAGKIHTIRTVGNQRRIPESEIIRISGGAVDNTALTEQKPQRSIVEIQEKQVIPTETVEIPAVISKSEDNYLLMCRDIPVYDVTKSVILNDSLIPGCMQKSTMDFTEWMQTRFSSDTNYSSVRFMQETYKTYNHDKILFETRAVSLSDSYWLRKEKEDIKFNEINLYNRFAPVANLFLRGKTDKRWMDTQTLLKLNAFGEFEPYILCSALRLDNITQAQVSDEGMMLGNFTSSDLFYESVQQYGIAHEDPRDILIEKFKEQAVALFVVDYLIENNDRHPDDYGFLRSSETGEYVSMAPYFNFDRAWSGESVALPESAWRSHRSYIHELCRLAMDIAGDFEYGTIIEKRANELLVKIK